MEGSNERIRMVQCRRTLEVVLVGMGSLCRRARGEGLPPAARWSEVGTNLV